jgi:hypothetical protein
MIRENLLTDHRFSWVMTSSLSSWLLKVGSWNNSPKTEEEREVFITWLTVELLALKNDGEQGRRGLRRDYHHQMGHQISVLSKLPVQINFSGEPYLIWHQYRVLDFLLEYTNLVAGVTVPRLLQHCPKCGVINRYKDLEWCGIYEDCPLKLD